MENVVNSPYYPDYMGDIFAEVCALEEILLRLVESLLFVDQYE